jgi:GNAT superfamily N-acetyltransferase
VNRARKRTPKLRTNLRSTTAADLEIILEHRIAMFRDMGFSDAVLASIERGSRQHLAVAVQNSGYYGLFAEIEDGNVVGGGGVLVVPWPGTEPRRCWIQNVYVKPEFRRRGIARQIMLALLDWCRVQGFDSVSLHASSDGRPLYEGLGFLPTNEMRLSLR